MQMESAGEQLDEERIWQILSDLFQVPDLLMAILPTDTYLACERVLLGRLR